MGRVREMRESYLKDNAFAYIAILGTFLFNLPLKHVIYLPGSHHVLRLQMLVQR